MLLDFLRRVITRRIVSRGVVAEPISNGLDEAWPFPRRGSRDCRVGCSAHGDDIVAVGLLSGKTRRDSLLS